MAIDIYSTRAQLAAIEQLPPVYSFLFDRFVADAGTVESDKAIYDYKKGSMRMAPVVHPNTGGVLMARDGYETREIGFCTIAPERIITHNDLQGRAFSEDILGAMTPEQRERQMLLRDLTDMRQAIQLRREWMARQVLLDGKLSVFRYTNEGRDMHTTLVADYGFTNTVTPATPWSSASADIAGDMMRLLDLVYDGLGAVDTIVMSPDAANAMLSNDKYLKTLDLRNADMGEINTRYRGQGVRFIGRNSDGVEMFSFAGKFVDDDNQVKPILPAGTVIAGSTGMLKCYHGPVTQVEMEGGSAAHKTYIRKEVPLRYGSIESNAIKNRLTSRPTLVPANVDGWAVASVL